MIKNGKRKQIKQDYKMSTLNRLPQIETEELDVHLYMGKLTTHSMSVT